MATLNIDYQLRQGTGATGEPIRKNTWEVMIPMLGPVHLYAQKVTLPSIEVEQLKVRHFNAETKLAGKVSYSDISLTIRDVVEPDMFVGITAWQKRVFDLDTRQLGYASMYKEMGFAYLYDSMGNIIRTYEMQGLWPKKNNPGDRDYNSAEGVELVLDLSCDNFRLI